MMMMAVIKGTNHINGDILISTSSTDTIYGYDGNDQLYGGAETATITFLERPVTIHYTAKLEAIL